MGADLDSAPPTTAAPQHRRHVKFHREDLKAKFSIRLHHNRSKEGSKETDQHSARLGSATSSVTALSSASATSSVGATSSVSGGSSGSDKAAASERERRWYKRIFHRHSADEYDAIDEDEEELRVVSRSVSEQTEVSSLAGSELAKYVPEQGPDGKMSVVRGRTPLGRTPAGRTPGSQRRQAGAKTPQRASSMVSCSTASRRAVYKTRLDHALRKAHLKQQYFVQQNTRCGDDDDLDYDGFMFRPDAEDHAKVKSHHHFRSILQEAKENRSGHRTG
ncbi:hypothetical protein GNI_074260 [Gregarina niphandrodes]|uniref:Uncharacterized protein n=1 Tax=Gregarina niphandrodes TaxID=110365 RepID=A0A023B6Z1_GRENI|nr:hypothetical protein GNI_074260 [Gregarina niphandrodes]EZG66900.1 hypothetical protein GNI_074260 [Gregarina niphandrodes]|eukprot:XP_011130433.1 hypothetical protein GNI_074260 [Gregarina niphandrodes]